MRRSLQEYAGDVLQGLVVFQPLAEGRKRGFTFAHDDQVQHRSVEHAAGIGRRFRSAGEEQRLRHAAAHLRRDFQACGAVPQIQGKADRGRLRFRQLIGARTRIVAAKKLHQLYLQGCLSCKAFQEGVGKGDRLWGRGGMERDKGDAHGRESFQRY